MKTDKQLILSVSLKVAFIAAILGSTIYLLVLGWYNSFILDDYGFIAETDRRGVLGMVHEMYYYQQSRFSAFLVLGWILKVWGHASNLIGYTIVLLLLGYGVIYYALRNITAIQDKWLLVGCGILITNVSIMAYLEIGTFYWLCCALYTLSAYSAIALITTIFYNRGKGWVRWVIVLCCSLYLCGGAENFTPLVIAILGTALIYQMIKSRSWVFWKTTEQRMILVSIVVLFAGFVVVLLGPGTSDRVTEGDVGYMEHFALMPFITKFAGASAVFSMRLVSRGLYYLLLFPIGMLLGRRASESNAVIWKQMLIPFVIVVGLIELSIAASVFGMGWYAPLRSYSFVSFMLAALITYWGAIAGRKYRSDSNKWITVLAAVFITAISIRFVKTEYPVVKDYHAQIAQRNAEIQEHVVSGSAEPLELSPIPYPSMPNTYAIMRYAVNSCFGKTKHQIAEPFTYFPYEKYGLTKNPTNWKNQVLKKYFKADFDIIGWEEED